MTFQLKFKRLNRDLIHTVYLLDNEVNEFKRMLSRKVYQVVSCRPNWNLT